jgi:hypothetical protein
MPEVIRDTESGLTNLREWNRLVGVQQKRKERVPHCDELEIVISRNDKSRKIPVISWHVANLHLFFTEDRRGRVSDPGN